MNPFQSSTRINYSLPSNYGRAKMQVSDMSGRIIKTIAITGTGRGTLSIDAASLAAGVYNYSMYVDERMIGTRQMILGK